MAKTRTQYNAVKTYCDEMASCTYEAIRNNLTADQLDYRRNFVRAGWVGKRAKWTRADHAQAWGYERAMYDIVWSLVEWRLGTELTGPVDAGKWPYGDKADGTRNLPTHGAHFWKGTNKPYTEWKQLWNTDGSVVDNQVVV